MPFGCPYPAGSDEAKQFMAELRAMRGQKAGKSALRKRRSRRGGSLGSQLGDFFKRFVKGVKYAHEQKGDFKERVINWADEMSGDREIREQRNAIYSKLNRKQRDLLKKGIWISESENGLPYEYFAKMTPNPSAIKVRGGAVPVALLSLIANVGFTAAMKLWNYVKNKRNEEAWRIDGGAWLGTDGKIHSSTVHPGMVGATRPRGGAKPNIMLPSWALPPRLKFTNGDVKKALEAYAKRYKGPKMVGGWEPKLQPEPIIGAHVDNPEELLKKLEKFAKHHPVPKSKMR